MLKTICGKIHKQVKLGIGSTHCRKEREPRHLTGGKASYTSSHFAHDWSSLTVCYHMRRSSI